MASELRKITRLAKRAGIEVEISKRTCHVIFRKDGKQVAVASSTASDNRSLKNTVRDLRAAGVPIPHRGGHAPKERGNQPR